MTQTTTRSSATRRAIAGLAPLALAAATACTAVNNYKTADTLGAGNTDLVVAPQVHGAGFQDTAKAPFPELAVSLRRGVTDDLDVAGTVTALKIADKITAYGVEAAGKAHLWRSASGKLDLAMGVGAGYRAVASSGAVFETVQVSAPLTLGINFGADQLAISPTLYWQRWYSMKAAPVDFPAAGFSLGYRWHISNNWALLPEVGWAWSPTGANAFDSSVLVHFGIGVVRGIGR